MRLFHFTMPFSSAFFRFLLFLYAPFILQCTLFAEDARKQLMLDPANPGFGDKGFLITLGPAFKTVQRSGRDFSRVPGQDLQQVQGPSSSLYGAALETAYDVSTASGIHHLLPGAGVSLFPDQGAYFLSYAAAPIRCHHYHGYLNLYYGRSSPVWKIGRHCVAAGPTLNLLLWQKNGVLQRLAWGLGAGYYYVRPWRGKTNLVVSVSYKFTPYTNFYWDAFMDMDEYHHLLTFSAGAAF